MKREVFLQNMMTAIAADIELEFRRKKNSNIRILTWYWVDVC